MYYEKAFDFIIFLCLTDPLCSFTGGYVDAESARTTGPGKERA